MDGYGTLQQAVQDAQTTLDEAAALNSALVAEFDELEALGNDRTPEQKQRHMDLPALIDDSVAQHTAAEDALTAATDTLQAASTCYDAAQASLAEAERLTQVLADNPPVTVAQALAKADENGINITVRTVKGWNIAVARMHGQAERNRAAGVPVAPDGKVYQVVTGADGYAYGPMQGLGMPDSVTELIAPGGYERSSEPLTVNIVAAGMYEMNFGRYVDHFDEATNLWMAEIEFPNQKSPEQPAAVEQALTVAPKLIATGGPLPMPGAIFAGFGVAVIVGAGTLGAMAYVARRTK